MSFSVIKSFLFYACLPILAYADSSARYCESTTWTVDGTSTSIQTRCYTRAVDWITSTYTISATTYTADPYTETDPGTTATYSDSENFPGYTDTAAYLTTTIKPTTFTWPAETVTVTALTKTTIIPALALLDVFPPDVIALIHDVAPTVTSIDIQAASKINSDVEGIFNSYTTATPMPTIISKIADDVSIFFNTKGSASSIGREVLSNMYIFPSPTDSARYSSSLASLLQPYPTISSEVYSYLTVASSWWAPVYLAQATALAKDLNLTGPLPPVFDAPSSLVGSSTATGGSAKPTNAAMSINGPSLGVNAVIAAVGMAVVGLL